MKRIITICSIALAIVLSLQLRAQVLITQIYEGTSNNKFIEITNIGTAPVDLGAAQYNVKLYSNKVEIGSNPPQYVKNLTGTLNAGQSLLLKHPQAAAPSYALSYSPGDTALACSFNGKGSSSAPDASTDIIALYTNTTLVDVFGWGTFNYEDDSWVRLTNTPSSTWNVADWQFVALTDVDNAGTNDPIRLGFHGAITPTPTIMITSPLNNAIVNSANVTVTFNVFNFTVGTDGLVRYDVDNGNDNYQANTNPIQLTGLADGQHTIEVELVQMDSSSLNPAVTHSITFTVNTSTTGTPIHDIQYTTNSNGNSPLMGTVVTTSGIVTGVHASGYFIQDAPGAWNGIYVYDNVNKPNMGDNITVTGTVDEYYNLTEIKNVTSYTVNSTGNTEPAPEFLGISAAKNEQYESVLVKVTNVKCTFVNSTGGWFKVAQGNDTINVDKLLYTYPNPQVGTNYDIVGIIYYTFSSWRLEPRGIYDISIATSSVSDPANVQVAIYPVPAKNSITIQYPNIKVVEISNLLGQTLIRNNVGNSFATLNISDLQSGIYIIKITTNEGNTVLKKFIKE